jgi:hypothetical protein
MRHLSEIVEMNKRAEEKELGILAGWPARDKQSPSLIWQLAKEDSIYVSGFQAGREWAERKARKATKQVKVSFSENNSGGFYRMLQEHYDALASQGWNVQGIIFGARYGGRCASKLFNTLAEGVAEWEEVTGLFAEARGCECCGVPYQFVVDED